MRASCMPAFTTPYLIPLIFIEGTTTAFGIAFAEGEQKSERELGAFFSGDLSCKQESSIDERWIWIEVMLSRSQITPPGW